MSFIDRKMRLKARRALRKQKRQVEAVTSQADDGIERLVFKRFARLLAVRKFVGLWTVLVVTLSVGALWQVRGLDKFYLTTEATTGGTYREGVMGAFTNANPLFATSPVDVSISRLLFSGLFKVSPKGKLVGDLAKDLKIDKTGKIYTVSLRSDVKWHDGAKFSADDVVFTYDLIKNPEVKSPLLASWSGVDISKKDNNTVVFKLPNELSSFKYALTNGIVPKHILATVDTSDLRSSSFNTTNLIGTGPFILRKLVVEGNAMEDRHERIALSRFKDYYGDAVGLDGVTIRSYQREEEMISDFQKQSIQAMIGLSSVPDQVEGQSGVKIISVPMTSLVMVFFNNSRKNLNNNIRKALVQATDVKAIRDSLGFKAVPGDSPFLRSQFSYDPSIVQFPYDLKKAEAILDAEGWKLNKDGERTKDGKQLSFRLVSQSLSEYASIAQKIQQQWGAIGINVDAVLQPEEGIQSGAISKHEYDILLYGISIGYDPDVFAYWHSSQADSSATTRLNLSEYKSDVADESLEAGRTRLNETLRKIKYQPFLKAWRDDAPAIALYQPRFLMVVRGTFEGFESGRISSATDRFWSISQWKIRNVEVAK